MAAVNGAATNYSISASSTGWLSATSTFGTLPANVAIVASPSGLATGTYQGTINVTFTGGVNGTQSIPVTLVGDAPPILGPNFREIEKAILGS